MESRDTNIESLPNGAVAIRVFDVSIDPYQRSKFKSPEPKQEYPVPWEKGKPLFSLGVGKIEKSKSSEWKEGDVVLSYGMNWEVRFALTVVVLNSNQEYCILEGDSVKKLVRLPDEDIPYEMFIGGLGMPGLTAYA